MQLRIGDRPAFPAHTIGAEARIGLHQRFVTLAVVHVALGRSSPGPVARIKPRPVGHQLVPHVPAVGIAAIAVRMPAEKTKLVTSLRFIVMSISFLVSKKNDGLFSLDAAKPARQ